MQYEIKRGTTTVATVTPTGSQQRAVMGKDVVAMNFTLKTFVQFAIEDTVQVFGKTYVLNRYPQVEKVSSYQYNYTAQFEAEGYNLNKIQYMLLDSDGSPLSSDFPLTTNASGFVDLIVSNMNRASSGWSKGTVDDTDTVTLSFSEDNCRSALAKIADQFKTEFWIYGKVINMTKQGQETTLEFQYGKGNGLYSIRRATSNDKDVFSRLYVYGSTKNLPADYRGGKQRLQLPGTQGFIQKTDQFNDYGLIETTLICDGSNGTKEIYPHRTGTISAVTDAFTFTDSGMDFDLNDQLIPVVTATIEFQTGLLAGYELQIASYNAATKTFTILQDQNEKAFKVPDESGLKPAVGDTYVLLNIEMPSSYITAAENDLQTAGNDYYDKNSNGREVYTVDCDPLYFQTQNLDTLNLGDFVTIADTPMSVDRSIRLIGIERDLQLTFKYTLTLADTASIAVIVREYFEQQNTQIIIRRNNLNNVNRARRNWRNTADLEDMVFDPEGNYYTEKIKPESIETLYLAAGAKAQNYALNGVVITPNKLGNPANMDVSAGQLVHYTLEVPGVGSVWNMTSASFTGLDPAKAYYLFARISTSALTGQWRLLESPVTVDSEAGYYNLGVGVLYEVEDGYRSFEFNKGMTYIVGDMIKTGKIQSIDAQNYFDLTHGRFNLGNSTSGLDWDVTKPNTLSIRGTLVVNPGGASSPIGVFRGAYDAATTYYKGDTFTYNGSLWMVVSDMPISGITPTLTAPEYQVQAQRGDPGSGSVVRVIYNKNSDPDNAPALDVNDANPAGWTLTMPQVDTHWLLSTEEGDYIATEDGDEFLVSVDGEYIWGSTEVLKEDGTFDHWSAPTRISGRNGIPNEYTEYRFQKNGSPTVAPTVDKTNATPTGWTVEMPAVSTGEYLWLIKANKLPNGALVSAWSDPVRTNGVDGGAASKGDPGPFMQYRGAWNAGKIYTGTAQHIDGVKYNGAWYVARVDAGDIPSGTLPTDTDYWNSFAGQFESVATGLLLAELAYIENLGVKYVRTSETGQRIEIDGVNNNLVFYDEFGNEVLRIDDNVDSTQAGNPLAGMRVTDPATGRIAFVTGNGLFANASGMSFYPGSSGITTNGSVVGLLFSRNSDPDGISAAVVGIDGTSSGASESWGGFFSSLRVTGKVQFDGGLVTGAFSPKTKQIASNYQCDNSDCILTCYNQSGGFITVTLPTVGDGDSRMMWVRRVNSNGGVSINAGSNTNGGSNQLLGTSSSGATYSIDVRKTAFLFWDGQYWHVTQI